MFFVAPIWLLGVAPWAGLALWLLWGRRQKTHVPFLPLWRAEEARLLRRRPIERPPVALAAMLLAILLVLLTAADPVVRSPHARGEAVVVILDRGLTMSGTDARGERRYVEDAQIADAALAEQLPEAPVDLRIVPGVGSETYSRRDWMERVRSLAPTGVVDDDAMALAAREALASTTGPVLLLSDQDVFVDDRRLIQIAPSTGLTNVGIESLAVRIDPRPQAMIGLFNQSPLGTATLSVRAGDQEISRRIQLPPRGKKQNYFVDLSTASPVVEADVSCDDNLTLDHQAWVVRQQAWPKIEARSSLPAELRRMIEVYTRRRPASSASGEIAVQTSSDANVADMPAAIVADEQAPGKPLASMRPLLVSEGPPGIGGLNWEGILKDAVVLPPPPGQWTPIVSAGGDVVVAVRSEPAREVWVGFRSNDFPRQVDFVVFWSEVFDWLGGGAPVYVSTPLGRLEGNWHLERPLGLEPPVGDTGFYPGLYRAGDGMRRAMNAVVASIPAPVARDWRSRLRAQAEMGQNVRPLGEGLLLTAMGLICMAGMTGRAKIKPIDA